ncbi:hypothetical protein CC78DRAFT_154335 [Lojkania enalia]|uniref:DUF7704 domain-containing protein n=1 Tax=Lojkania enalia TaxID=147567 RepID=A0A9P4N8S5_9PLEO|nr:hypothetical protein CC78DRAFT_154335 [Didymosphaeria enalia]
MAANNELPYVPLLYRLLFLYLEPLFAINGALLCLFSPATFLRTFSATAIYASSNQPIYDQLAATYILFAFNEAIVLRTTKDLRVWRTIILGILVCDVLHLYAAWRVLGVSFWDPRDWRVEEWTNFGLLYGPGVIRVMFLLGIGIKEKEKKR